MILADKIIKERKRNGWSQEELAEKMNVSRQAVSKWESAAAVPDLEKILRLSQLFGVTCDYLLKDDIDTEEFIDSKLDYSIRKVGLEEANKYMDIRKKASVLIGIATVMCILSPVPLIFLATACTALGISEEFAALVGLIILFILAASAVGIFIFCSFRNDEFGYLEKEIFELEYGVKGIVEERKKKFRNTYIISNIIGTCLCILAVIPLLIGGFSENEIYTIIGLCVTFVFVAAGVFMFIFAGVRNASMDKILCRGDYTNSKKKKSKKVEKAETIYWCIVTAIYLGWSFISFDWGITWIIWPVAAVLSALIPIVFDGKDED